MYALPFPAIDPVLIELGPFAVRWYSLAYIAGILLGWRYMLRLTDRTEGAVSRQHIDDFVVWATLSIVLGGRLGYVLFYRPEYYFANPIEIGAMWKGGMSFHGGMLGVIAAIFLFTRRRGIRFLCFGDLVCAAAPIGLFFGRIANFINGELFGRASDVPWAMVFPRSGPLPRHPSQLYESTLEGLVLFIVIALLITRYDALKKPGLVIGTFLAGYGIARILVEFVRQPDEGVGLFLDVVTRGQLLSAPLLLLGLWIVWRAIRNARPRDGRDSA